jgi:PAS domain S-box-containing protein
MLRANLEHVKGGKYDLLHVNTLEKLRSFELESICHAILIDMRCERDESLKAIHYIADLETGVALIALCRDHEQLQRYKEVIHLLDDYILAEHLVDGELPTRITHAIRRRGKEQALLREKTRLQSLLDNIPDAIFFKDRESRFTKVNKRMERIYGKYHKSIIGKTDFDLFSEEHARAAYNDEQEIIRTGESIVGKLEKETFEDGHFNWVNTTKVPLKDDHDRIIGTMGISRDITDLKKAQDTLAQERTLLKTIIEHALAGIFVKDLAGRYLVVNQRHTKYLGAQSDAEVIGKTLYDFFEQGEAARISATDEQIMGSGEGIENLVDYRQRADGSELWLLTSKVPLWDEDRRCIGLVGISFDVTEQKQAERSLKSAIQTLEETKLQLIEAEKLKTVGRLAAGVAHEVKNPLNVVSLGAEYLEGQIEGPEEMLQVVRDMREAIQKANNVIFELLDYSSPHKVKMQAGNINEIISRVLGLMRHNFNEACIKVDETLSSEIDPVRLDAPKMEQVFINLFLNAISVMKKGGSLSVRTDIMKMKSTGANVSSAMTELFRIGDTIVVIEVLDTGTGLSKEDQSKAFDPFYSTKATGEGTGLGLSVTRSIIEMHHGLITLQNRTDTQGACVRILLPAAT